MKRAGAVAMVVAAVDMARVRQPEDIEADLKQAGEHQSGASWTPGAGVKASTAQEFLPEPRVLPQVS